MCGMNILIIKGSPRKNGMGDYFLGQVTEYLKDNINEDPDFASQFKCTECIAGDDKDAGEILKEGDCLPCSEISHCVRCNGQDTHCEECAKNYQLKSDGTCEISDLVIALPIAGLVGLIVIILVIIVVIIIVKHLKKDKKNQNKELKPFKVSTELEMTLLSADNENFPLKTEKWDLDFGLTKDKAKIDREYTQEIQFVN